MPDEKPNKYEPVPSVPIPSYEEAIGSSSYPLRSPTDNEPAHPAEREGLLGPSAAEHAGHTPIPTRRSGYRPPTTEDGHDDEEADTFLGQDGGEEEEVRREMEEMEFEEPPPSPLRSAWGKRLSSLSSRLPWLSHLHFEPSWPKLTADLCILIGRCFAIVLVMAVVYLLFVSDTFANAAARQVYDPEMVRMHLQGAVNAQMIETYARIVTETDHLAGTEGDWFLAEKVAQIFRTDGQLEDVHMEEYGVYLNYPKAGGRKVELLNEDGSVKWRAKIEEPNVYSNPSRQQTPVFHGHSKSGDVKGPLIYANYGSRRDYMDLTDSAINVTGAIALVRHFGSQGDRALKVKAAEMIGFAGCIIFSDPAEDGFKKGTVAPGGRFMPGGAVQRGAVSLMSWVVGDVLTPGWASTKGAKRIPKENNPALLNIPSIPISWEDAKPLLEAIKGFGFKGQPEWQGGIPGMEYWTGNLSSPVVHLLNDQDEEEQQPIWNVVGKILGNEQSEKSIIIGNHRDAWVFGASDPGSGTAVMLEVVRVFGDLVSKGWRPLRTIEFISWDAEEYNLIGSTEHVEEHIEKIRADAYVYINLDVAVAGQDFKAAGSPVFKKSLMRVLSRTSDPVRNVTLRHLWDERRGQLDGLGAGSDYVAFQDIAGTSSLDLGFDGPGFPYHSAYDNFELLSSVIDPGFQYHAVLAQVVALLVLDFSYKLILPFDISAYSSSLLLWTMDLENWVANKGVNQDGNPKWDINPLREAAMQFAMDAKLFEKWEEQWENANAEGGFEGLTWRQHRISHNNRMANFETNLLDLEEGGGVSFPRPVSILFCDILLT